jgi:FKBP12-rapamycin complex-associated protein
VSYLQSSLRKERERPAAFKAMGLMVYVLKDRMELEPVLHMVRSNLPASKESTTK